MAAMPPQASSRNTSPSNQGQPQSKASSQIESTAPSMISEDSQTVLLDNTTSLTNTETPTKPSQPRPRAPSRSSTYGIKKCWICICDSTEDDPSHPPKWRSPCTCNLSAHEACLLDWVADLENPQNRGGGPPKKIQCPQCKSEIRIARPRSLVLSGVRAWERLTGTLTLPGIIGVLGGTIWAGCFYHGVYSICFVFGEPHASEIYTRASRHWGWLCAYALIPLSLISARTNYADFVLPGSTIVLFAAQLSDRFAIDWTIWPPRPSTVFGCLPLVRNCYNYLYEKTFGGLERRWIQDIQPRQGQYGNEGERNEADQANDLAAAMHEMGEGDVVLELNLEIGVGDGEDEVQLQHQGARDGGEAQPAPPVADAAANNNPPPADANLNANPNPNQVPPAAPAPALLNRRPADLISTTSSIFLTTLGALCFPPIASTMGSLLYHTLPASWVMTPSTPRSFTSFFSNSNNGREELLRTKWGRSVVGGCLFVVLKDALGLYVKWRMARAQRERRVLDWDRGKGEWVLRD